MPLPASMSNQYGIVLEDMHTSATPQINLFSFVLMIQLVRFVFVSCAKVQGWSPSNKPSKIPVAAIRHEFEGAIKPPVERKWDGEISGRIVESNQVHKWWSNTKSRSRKRRRQSSSGRWASASRTYRIRSYIMASSLYFSETYQVCAHSITFQPFYCGMGGSYRL